MKIKIRPSFWKKIPTDKNDDEHSLKNILKDVALQDVKLIAIAYMNMQNSVFFKEIKKKKAKLIHNISKAVIEDEK